MRPRQPAVAGVFVVLGIFADLLRLNRTMRWVLIVIAVSSVVAVVMLWRHYQVRSLGQDARYQAPMRRYSAAEKKMVRGKFDKALKEYHQAREMLAAIPGIDLETDFYYAIVNNSIGTIHLRRGIYGEKGVASAEGVEITRNPGLIELSLGFFETSAAAYRAWLAANRPDSTHIGRLRASREGKKADEIELEPFERYERALSVTLCNLGIAARYLGQVDLARERYEEALQLWPGQQAAVDNLAVLESDLAGAANAKENP
ncbi:MAG: hypothetical protein JW781_03345 [Deltaproteobacteria bacterium]|nr:hypothetical protein [Candidatus Anaeroferrophillacea bacterium]